MVHLECEVNAKTLICKTKVMRDTHMQSVAFPVHVSKIFNHFLQINHHNTKLLERGTFVFLHISSVVLKQTMNIYKHWRPKFFVAIEKVEPSLIQEDE